MNNCHNDCAHPGDASQYTTSGYPVGFASNQTFISTLPVSEVIGAPTDNVLKTKGRATATSLTSQSDADQKALDAAEEEARLRMEFLLNDRNPPKGEWFS